MAFDSYHFYQPFIVDGQNQHEQETTEAEGATLTGVFACLFCGLVITAMFILDVITLKTDFLRVKQNIIGGYVNIKEIVAKRAKAKIVPKQEMVIIPQSQYSSHCASTSTR